MWEEWDVDVVVLVAVAVAVVVVDEYDGLLLLL